MRLKFVVLRPESDHLLHLDALRLIASAGIVIHHMVPYIDARTWSGALLEMSAPLALFVDMFFVVSGFVIAFVYSEKIRNTDSYARFLRKRIARLVPLHWATLGAFLTIGIFLKSHNVDLNHAEIYDWHCLPTNFFLLQSTGLCPHVSYNGVSWSISAEMCMYLTAPIFIWLMRRNPLTVGGMAAAAWLILVLSTKRTDEWLTWTFTGGVLRAIPSFLFGVYLFGIRSTVAKLPFAGVMFWATVLGFIVGCSIGLPQIALLLILYAAVAFGIAADAQRKRSRIINSLAAGGQLTYSSYMLHPLICMLLISGLAERVMHVHGPMKNIFLLVVFATIWTISYVSLMFFEKPAREWIGGRTINHPKVVTTLVRHEHE